MPSTISTVSRRKRPRGRSASKGPSRLTIRPAADFQIPTRGANCRKVRFVRQYAGAHRAIPSVGDPVGAVRPSELTATQRASAQDLRPSGGLMLTTRQVDGEAPWVRSG
ncbi:hypothetical protein GCM10023257_03450 [Streptomyces hyderabadensis]|uniref:Uncharacterized protein n=1 Tax=Streptomyces hyderabadensis TaxID=598549 RepID=A0ABP9HHE3_9ACTN